MKTQTIGFIGCGNMATAIIGGLINADWPVQSIMVSNPSNPKLDNLKANFKVNVTNDNLHVAQFSQIIVLAVKPQILSSVCQELAALDLSDKLIISVAAGYQTASIIKHLGIKNLAQQPAIIRAMPNTPALIGVGATGLFATEMTSAEQIAIADNIFQSVGQTNWIDKESQMNVVTAIAGSSPAYFYLMMQAMVEQAVESGLTQQAAFELVTQSAKGAAQLAQLNPQKTLQKLREEVTSPGGTTAAAIKSFQSNDFEQIIKQSVQASIARGIELGQLN